MEIHPRLIPVLQSIDFGFRYKSLCDKYGDFDKRLKEYDRNVIRDLLEQKGLHVTYVRNERFFRVLEPIGNFRIQLNIIPENGFIQFVWDLKYGGVRYTLSWGTWEAITYELLKMKTGKPIFASYAELKEILEEVFLIYTDFKRELSKMQEVGE